MVKKSPRAPRDTQNYTLYGPLGNPVYHGISNDPDRRIREHERDGKNFTNVAVSPKRSRGTAEQRETEAIHDHQRRNFGIPPQYNEAKVDRDQVPSFGSYNQPRRRTSGQNIFGFRFP
jgi:hypothetical protein